MLKKSYRRWLSLTILASALMFSGSLWAGQAENLVKAKRTQVAKMLEQKASTSRDKKVAGVLSDMFDYDAVTKKSMGKHWSKLTPAQQKEFQGVLTQLIQRNLENSVEKTKNFNITFLGESKKGDNTVVKTKATHKTDARKDPFQIDYVLHENSGKWRVNDMVTEGSSMVSNYRRQFNSIMKSKGYDELLKKMKKKLAKMSKK
jgi:phospholipid transport system substrate-binding protein